MGSGSTLRVFGATRNNFTNINSVQYAWSPFLQAVASLWETCSQQHGDLHKLCKMEEHWECWSLFLPCLCILAFIVLKHLWFVFLFLLFCNLQAKYFSLVTWIWQGNRSSRRLVHTLVYSSCVGVGKTLETGLSRCSQQVPPLPGCRSSTSTQLRQLQGIYCSHSASFMSMVSEIHLSTAVSSTLKSTQTQVSFFHSRGQHSWLPM